MKKQKLIFLLTMILIIISGCVDNNDVNTVIDGNLIIVKTFFESCSDSNGFVCTENEYCRAEWIDYNDGNVCCSKKCSEKTGDFAKNFCLKREDCAEKCTGETCICVNYSCQAVAKASEEKLDFIEKIKSRNIINNLGVETQKPVKCTGSYDIDINYDEGKISLGNLQFDDRLSFFGGEWQPENEYFLAMMDDENNIAYAYEFKFELELFPSQATKCFDQNGNSTLCASGPLILTQNTWISILPYFPTVTKIIVYDPDTNPVLEIDTTEFAYKRYPCKSNEFCDAVYEPESNKSVGVCKELICIKNDIAEDHFCKERKNKIFE